MAHLVRHDRPIIITIVDSAEKIARLVPAVEGMMDIGLIASSDVRCIRIQREEPPANARS